MVLDRKTAPRIYDAIEFDYKLPPINKEVLSNGLPLYWLNAGVLDVVELNWVFPSGGWQEHQPGLASAVAALLKNGTSKRTAHQVHEALEFYGAMLNINAGDDYGTLSLHALTKHLPELLPIIREIITEAIFPEEELVIHKQNAIQKLLVNQRQCEFVANQKIDAVIFGEAHPYGRFTKKENIEAITRDGMMAFYKQAYALANVTMFMAGNVGAKEVKLINDIFGTEPVSKQIVIGNTVEINPATEKKYNILNDPNGVQGAIRIGMQFPNRQHPDFAPMVVLNTIYGGYFGSRLMSNIREDKGYTYGIYSSLSPSMHGGSLTIHTEVGRDVIQAAIKEIYHEMQELRSNPAAEDELLLVKNYLLGNLLGDLDGPFSILQRWRTLILNGLTVEHFNKNVNIYKTVTARELQDLANKYYNIDQLYEIVVI
jgi:predicted Zn-dependent peptidase